MAIFLLHVYLLYRALHVVLFIYSDQTGNKIDFVFARSYTVKNGSLL